MSAVFLFHNEPEWQAQSSNSKSVKLLMLLSHRYLGAEERSYVQNQWRKDLLCYRCLIC